VFFFLLLPGIGGGSNTRNGKCFFFLLLPGTGGGSYTLHCPPGSAIEFVTGLCRTDNPVTDRHDTVAFIYKIAMKFVKSGISTWHQVGNFFVMNYFITRMKQ
jgi:hypothetical protein